MFHPGSLQDALDALGIALADRGLAYEAVVVGGGCLLLHGWIRRPTKDLDIIALVMDGEYVLAEPFPVPLQTAVHDVADLLSLSRDWFNPGPTSQLRTGLPDGFRERVEKRTYGPLTLHLAGRFDLICLKLFAAADDSPRGKHAADLRQLAPRREELAAAARWVKGQDASPEFSAIVDDVVRAFGGGDDIA